MTLEEIRQTVRDLTKEWEEDSGTLFPSGDALLDRFINWSAENVVLDLVEFMQEDFLTYEDISITSGDFDYDLTAEWLQVWAMQRLTTDKGYQLIPYTPLADRRDYVGETAEDARGWFLKGTQIIFWPTPSATRTVRCWIVGTEVATMVAAGPSYIPRMAHKLIPLDAAILIGYMNDREVGNIVALYKIQKDRVIDSLTNRVQQQPQFLRPSVYSRISGDRRDPAFFDKFGYFSR